MSPLLLTLIISLVVSISAQCVDRSTEINLSSERIDREYQCYKLCSENDVGGGHPQFEDPHCQCCSNKRQAFDLNMLCDFTGIINSDCSFKKGDDIESDTCCQFYTRGAHEVISMLEEAFEILPHLRNSTCGPRGCPNSFNCAKAALEFEKLEIGCSFTS